MKISKPMVHPIVEVLESRIAPATLALLPTIKDAEIAFDLNPIGDKHFVQAVSGSPILLKAGQVLTTGTGARSGSYLMFVEKGQMLVFTTDLNNNGKFDFNEITGIAAGDGLRFISFVDIHGDIVTNLDADTTLSDSDNNSSGNDFFLKGDGLVLNNARIESITLRSLTAADLTDQNSSVDGAVNDSDVSLRLTLSSYSIFGQVLAGKGFGVVGDPTSGLLINDAGFTLQAAAYGAGVGLDYYYETKSSVGAIRTGTAASGEYISFGASSEDNIQGRLRSFTPPAGQVGGDIYNVRSTTSTHFNIRGLYSGDGGTGARGGNIDTVTLNGDTASGYEIVAGNGGKGPAGGAGGSIYQFSDIGSYTGQVTLKIGDGGTGSTGAGGNGGVLGLNTIVGDGTQSLPVNINVNGGISILLGDGGSGFTNGGNGANLAKAVLTPTEGAVTYSRQLVATTHDGLHDPITGKLLSQGGIGRSIPVDFDQDGSGDLVFTTTDPDQLVVQFGSVNAGFTDRIYLDGPASAEALAVGDFNGDGHMDIVVASSAAGSFGGLMVYLSKWEDSNVNGLSTAEDLNHNGKDDFLGFYSPIYSTLPSLAAGDSAGAPYTNYFYSFVRSGTAINDIAVGDFNGDGYTDLAVSATYLNKDTFIPNQVVMVLDPDIEGGRPTGQFFADVGQKAQGQPPVGANPYVPFYAFGVSGLAQLEATALSKDATHDTLLVANIKNDVAYIPSTLVSQLDFSVKSVFGPAVNSFTFGKVDTDRLLWTPKADNVSLQDAVVRQFAVNDFNKDGNADVVIITETPESYVVALQGDGLGNGDVVTFNPAANKAGDNNGIPVGLDGSIAVSIRATDFAQPLPFPTQLDDVVGVVDDVAILTYKDNGFVIKTLSFLDYSDLPTTPKINPGIDDADFYFGGFVDVADKKIVAFDTYFLDSTSTELANYGVGNATQVAGLEYINSAGEYGSFRTIEIERYLKITAGDGGNGITGAGGAGGSLGGALLSVPTDITGTLVGSLDIVFGSSVKLLAGKGGNGFTSGGVGGNIQGTHIHGGGSVLLIAGDGGSGVSKAGGSGGSIISNVLLHGIELKAGKGGNGFTGGNGGSIVGHGLSDYTDNEWNFQLLYAGSGGNGITRGGDGGGIRNFHAQTDIVYVGDTAGIVVYVAGKGGNAVAGPGGNGGDVTSVNPFAGENTMSGDIYLRGGDAGNGTVGGSGGNVSGFINKPSTGDVPAVLSFLGGNGGTGSKGAGGRGGNVTNISTPATGAPSYGSAPLEDGFPQFGAERASVYSYNRILGGAGGASFSGTGGSGGSVSQILTGNTDGSFVIAAGAAGTGLRVGGTGGSVSGVRLDTGGGSLAKALIIAGEGGAASAFVSNSFDSAQDQAQKAFGGTVGRGGLGGSISNFTQEGALGSHVDLIAGNGGDTPLYGSVADSLTYVGRGGSISGISLAGNLGNVSSTVPIKAYNDWSQGQSMGDFVSAVLRDGFAAGSISDNIGNVGAVVGAAGRLKSAFSGFDSDHKPIFASLPAYHAQNGDLINVSARNIMSAVAGNVERIASIHSVQNLNVSGLVGSDKGVLNSFDYLDKNGNPVTEPVTDGSLIDGALLASTSPTGSNITGNIFVLP